MKKLYFLFGQEAIGTLEEGIDVLIRSIQMDGLIYDVYCWEHNAPIDLLEAYSGWNDYMVISKSDYNQIIKL